MAAAVWLIAREGPRADEFARSLRAALRVASVVRVCLLRGGEVGQPAAQLGLPRQLLMADFGQLSEQAATPHGSSARGLRRTLRRRRDVL